MAAFIHRAQENGGCCVSACQRDGDSLLIIQLPFLQGSLVRVCGHQILPGNAARIGNQVLDLAAVQWPFRLRVVPELIRIHGLAFAQPDGMEGFSHRQCRNLRNCRNSLHRHQVLLCLIEYCRQRGRNGVDGALLPGKAQIVTVREGRCVTHAVGRTASVLPARGNGEGRRFQTVISQIFHILQLACAQQAEQAVRHGLHSALQYRPGRLVRCGPGVIGIGKGIGDIVFRPAESCQIIHCFRGQIKGTRCFQYRFRLVEPLHPKVSADQDRQDAQHQDHFLAAFHRRFLLM